MLEGRYFLWGYPKFSRYVKIWNYGKTKNELIEIKQLEKRRNDIAVPRQESSRI